MGVQRQPRQGYEKVITKTKQVVTNGRNKGQLTEKLILTALLLVCTHKGRTFEGYVSMFLLSKCSYVRAKYCHNILSIYVCHM